MDNPLPASASGQRNQGGSRRKELSNDEIDQLRVGLKEHFQGQINDLEKSIDRRFTAFEKSTEMQFQSLKEAVLVAKEAQEHRMDTTNEWRGSLDDAFKAIDNYTKTLVTQKAFEDFKASIEEKLAILHDFQTVMNSKASQTAFYISMAIALVGLVLGIWKLVK